MSGRGYTSSIPSIYPLEGSHSFTDVGKRRRVFDWTNAGFRYKWVCGLTHVRHIHVSTRFSLLFLFSSSSYGMTSHLLINGQVVNVWCESWHLVTLLWVKIPGDWTPGDRYFYFRNDVTLSDQWSNGQRLMSRMPQAKLSVRVMTCLKCLGNSLHFRPLLFMT